MTVKETVFKLLDEAQAHGEPLPSLRTLRARAGAGSLTTISQAVKQWRLSKMVESGQMPPSFSPEEEAAIGRAVWEIVTPMLLRRLEAIQDKANRCVEIEQVEAARLMAAANEILAEAEKKEAKEELWRAQFAAVQEQKARLEARLAQSEQAMTLAQEQARAAREESRQEQRKFLDLAAQTRELTEKLMTLLGERSGNPGDALPSPAPAASD